MMRFSRTGAERTPLREHRKRRKALQLAIKAGLRLAFLVVERFDDVFRHLLGVAEEHHRPIAVKQRIVDAGVA